MRCLGFCVSIEQARFMARHFNAHGIRSVAIWGDSPKSNREAALKNLAASRVNVVFSVELFNEGIDVPVLDTVLMLRPTEVPPCSSNSSDEGCGRRPTRATAPFSTSSAPTARSSASTGATALGRSRWPSPGSSRIRSRAICTRHSRPLSRDLPTITPSVLRGRDCHRQSPARRCRSSDHRRTRCPLTRETNTPRTGSGPLRPGTTRRISPVEVNLDAGQIHECRPVSGHHVAASRPGSRGDDEVVGITRRAGSSNVREQVSVCVGHATVIVHHR